MDMVSREVGCVAIRFGIFLMFALAASWQDYKTRQVNVRLFLVFGVVGLFLCLGSQIQMAFHAENTEGVRFYPELLWNIFCSILLGMLPGAALFLFSRCGGGIGEGDCLFFLICGWYLNIWDTCFLLGVSVFLCGFVGLVYYVAGCRHGSLESRKRGKTQWPFLPFTVLPGSWIAMMRLSEVIRMMAVSERGSL